MCDYLVLLANTRAFSAVHLNNILQLYLLFGWEKRTYKRVGVYYYGRVFAAIFTSISLLFCRDSTGTFFWSPYMYKRNSFIKSWKQNAKWTEKHFLRSVAVRLGDVAKFFAERLTSHKRCAYYRFLSLFSFLRFLCFDFLLQFWLQFVCITFWSELCVT